MTKKKGRMLSANRKEVMKDLAVFRELWSGFQVSRVVLTANNLGMFEALTSPRTAEDIAGRLKTDPRATGILLDAVASVGLLRKTGRQYRITPLARRFLLKSSHWYLGDMLRHADSLWKTWSGLDEVVRTGRPTQGGGRDHETFIRAMHNNSVLTAPGVVDSLDLRGVRTALDLGGGPGTYSIELARRGIEVTLFDLPDTMSIAREIVGAAGVKGTRFLQGDFHTDDIGTGYDLVLLSQILHSHSPEESIELLGKVRNVLKPKGKAVIHEFALAENRAAPPSGALFSINMLVNTPGGRSYTPREMTSWLKTAGFGPVRVKHLAHTVLVTGVKK